MLKLGLDIDSVVCEMIPTVLQKVNTKHRTALTKKDIIDWNMETSQFKLYNEIIDTFDDMNIMLGLPPVLGAKPALRILAEDFELIFITTRPKEYAQQTKRWVWSMLAVDGSEIHHVERDKNGIDVDILVDDNLGNVFKFAGQGKPAIVFDQPWNSEKAFLERVSIFWKDWAERPIHRAHGWLGVGGALFTIYEVAEKYCGDR